MWKRLAIVSSVVLVGGYIFLKAGVHQAIMPSTKRGHIVDEPKGETTLMPGSKSAAPFTSNGKLETVPPVMSSSKYMAPVITSPAAGSVDALTLGTTQPTTVPSTTRAK